MIQVIKRWHIILYFELSNKDITFMISDNHYHNMLTKLQAIQFQFDPTKIEIKLMED